jgi:hypothetical protein
MGISDPAFNLAGSPIVTDGRYAERDFVLLLQTLITQAARSTPVIVTFDELPASPYLGQPAVITDSTTNTWGATIAGGGAFGVLGVWTGVTWTVMGRTA